MSDGAFLLCQDSDRDDVARDAASSSEIGLLANIDIGDVFVLAKQRQVEDDLERLGISSQDDQVSDTTVQTLGSLVGTLLEELEVLGLVQQVEDGLLHGVVSERVGAGQVLAFILLVDRIRLGDFRDLDIRIRIDLFLRLLLLFVLLLLLVFLVLLLFLV